MNSSFDGYLSINRPQTVHQ